MLLFFFFFFLSNIAKHNCIRTRDNFIRYTYKIPSCNAVLTFNPAAHCENYTTVTRICDGGGGGGGAYTPDGLSLFFFLSISPPIQSRNIVGFFFEILLLIYIFFIPFENEFCPSPVCREISFSRTLAGYL